MHLVAFDLPGGSIGAVRLAQDGTLLDSVPLDIASYPYKSSHWSPEVAFGAGEFMVAWVKELDTGQDAGPVPDIVRAARVLPDGSVLDPGGVVVATAVASKVSNAAIVYDGQFFVLVWSVGGDLRAARVDPPATVIDPGGFHVASADFPSSVASDGAGRTLVAYEVAGAKANTWRARARILGPPDYDAGAEAAAGDAASDAATVDAADGSTTPAPDATGNGDATQPGDSAAAGDGGASPDAVANAGDAGASTDAASRPTSASAETSGCACREASPRRTHTLPVWLLLAVVAVADLRRRSG